MNIDLLKKLADTNGNIAIYQLIEIDRIVTKISQMKENLEEAQQEYDKITTEYRKSLKAIQKECKHLITSFIEDLSGNNDSYRQCDICGAEILRDNYRYS